MKMRNWLFLLVVLMATSIMSVSCGKMSPQKPEVQYNDDCCPDGQNPAPDYPDDETDNDNNDDAGQDTSSEQGNG